jgi:hypothetical protein
VLRAGDDILEKGGKTRHEVQKIVKGWNGDGGRKGVLWFGLYEKNGGEVGGKKEGEGWWLVVNADGKERREKQEKSRNPMD